MHDWIHFYDVFDRQIGTNQTYELMGYLPYAFAPWFAHFANHSNATRPAEFPKQDYEVRPASAAPPPPPSSLCVEI
jgi:chromosome transmission fidelity protein 18